MVCSADAPETNTDALLLKSLALTTEDFSKRK